MKKSISTYILLVAVMAGVLFSSCSRYTSGEMANANRLTIAQANENVLLAPAPIKAVSPVEASVKQELPKPAYTIDKPLKQKKIAKLAKAVQKLPSKVVEKASGMALSAMTKASVAKKDPPGNEKTVAIGIIMALSGTAAALILGLWLAPEIGSLVFLWMALAIFVAFWGIFIALLGVAYGWKVKSRFKE